MGLTLAFIMDPIERVNTLTDTTFAFMLAAQQRGHKIMYVRPQALELEGDCLFLHGQHIDVFADAIPGKHFATHKTVRLCDTECAAIFLRTDPPFNEAYLTVTWLLGFAERRGVRVINSPVGVRAANEKLFALEFAALCPDTLITSSRAKIDAFMQQHNGQAIAKPISGHGGYGVVRLRDGDSNVHAICDLLSAEGQTPILVQEYLPAAHAGDKRLLVIDGVLRGAVRRVPKTGDHRGNVHVGGNVEVCTIDARDQHIVDTMRDALQAHGLFFVGLDVIDGKLIEVNVTSPTLVQELRRLSGVDLADEVIAAVETGTQAT